MFYEFHKGNKAAEATKNICRVYKDVLSVRKCQWWFRKLKSGDFDLSDCHRSGRPVELDSNLLRTEVETDARQTIQQLSEKLISSWSSVQEHLKEIGNVNKQRVSFPHKFSDDNKVQLINICNSLITRHEKEPFLHQIVTGDEKLILYVNTKCKNRWLSPDLNPIPTDKPDSLVVPLVEQSRDNSF
ncbi:histone-lysine N-methyltransferase SETMAR-like [Limulus polyphemus]|uniref:Histone-lysine N-methyltransferase SETMAR-like n=1 Tax=Limulus polyphemus TaxID=6850 RepID=A0ABM1SYR7_LIMPO|nr:histone-lysine N-methyltransferase SETMAR-like [Limulus polyphemus]